MGLLGALCVCIHQGSALLDCGAWMSAARTCTTITTVLDHVNGLRLTLLGEQDTEGSFYIIIYT